MTGKKRVTNACFPIFVNSGWEMAGSLNGSLWFSVLTAQVKVTGFTTAPDHEHLEK